MSNNITNFTITSAVETIEVQATVLNGVMVRVWAEDGTTLLADVRLEDHKVAILIEALAQAVLENNGR